MGNLKEDDTDNRSLWQAYSLHPPSNNNAQIQLPYDSNYLPLPNHQYHGRQIIPPLPIRLSSRDDASTASPFLTSHHSYPSLKRSYDGSHDMGYLETTQDFREEVTNASKPSINPDHRLLNFGAHPPKHTIIDAGNRVKNVDLTAQIHGMFFLSELATPSAEHSISQPELTCYRRNLFSISGNVRVPMGPLCTISEQGERSAITSLEVTVSASESIDNHTVKLIIIPWKTPPPNSVEVATEGEQEPTAIPLIVMDDSGMEMTTNGEFAVFPIAFRRLQFRIATANNGRRRELQQHFLLHLNVVATLGDGSKINVSENSTAPVIVRGRSPRNFQTRKEIPLVGSSSSRGIPPELHITTGMLTQPAVVQRSATFPKPEIHELPRTSFTFDSSNLSGSPSILRQPSYSNWSNQQTMASPGQSHNSTATPSTSSSPYSGSISLDTYIQPSHLPHPHSHQSLPRSATLPGTRSNLPQYAFQASSSMLLQDQSSRPNKSPRHDALPELPIKYNTISTTLRDHTLPQPRAMGGAEYIPSPFPMSAGPSINTAVSYPPTWPTSNAVSPIHNTSGSYNNLSLQEPAISRVEMHQSPHYQLAGGMNTNGAPHNFSKQENDNSDGNHYTWNH